MDVNTYLNQVKLENDSLPKVVVIDTPKLRNFDSYEAAGTEDSKATRLFNRLIHIDEEYKKLDSGFILTDEELKYFKLLKSNIASIYGIQNDKLCSSIYNYARIHFIDQSHDHTDSIQSSNTINSTNTNNTSTISKNVNDLSLNREEESVMWKMLMDSEPPPISTICNDGINYACTEDCLHILGDLICQFPGSPLLRNRAKWLFIILLILDELHSMTENVSYDLQRIRRSLLRRSSMIESKELDTTEFSDFIDELCTIKLLSSLISTHFKQY
ncbi:uncharacterized protein TA13800 [Theileria annulata]|uniref:Uncharacterized protein n=1 Tax=Theileria annulata TaxID=5874 RepID=Q4UEQ4_THEAN|nr:uncharacterized protein TA13800 [Theileria annulata]CAI74435.1 hypothetical protein TA13800 [Theileria annulata]|eukprot:XP_952167.1 hypothetical protein TA13800 [Theileria annulata]